MPLLEQFKRLVSPKRLAEVHNVTYNYAKDKTFYKHNQQKIDDELRETAQQILDGKELIEKIDKRGK